MPTVLRKNGFSVMIYKRDHRPAHVHIHKGGHEVIVFIGSIAVRGIYGMKLTDVRKAQELVAEHQEFLRGEWKRITSQ